MIRPLEDRMPPMTPQLALRVAIIGGCALVMFAVIFFRLWFLQVLSGSEYLAQAKSNDTRSVEVAAPRGKILDAEGNIMVSSNPVPSILISAPDLPTPITDIKADLSTPPANDQQLYDRLAGVLSLSTKLRNCSYTLWVGPHKYTEHAHLTRIACLVAQGIGSSPYADVTIKANVSSDIRDYLAERSGQYPGVISEPVYERKYPLGDLAAQLFGTVGPITSQELKEKKFEGVPETDTVGQSGLEYEYDQDLRGKDGTDVAKVNADGEFEGWETSADKSAVAGENLQLSIHEKLQQVGEAALKQSISDNDGSGGAFVALDPDNGQVYAMGSAPTFDPSVFAKPITQKEYDELTSPTSGDPLLNRAIQSPGADGSTFKVITATAGLQSGEWTPDESYDDTGQFCFPNTTDCLHNSGHAAYGDVDIERAIEVSDDVFFYHLGYILNGAPVQTQKHPNGGVLQKWARAYGIGQRTGIDLPGEASGTLPDPKVFRELWKQEVECENATGPYKGDQKHPADVVDGYVESGGCGIADTDLWSAGDNVNTAVGQGDDQVTPIQLAVVYAALANGGTIVTPHVGEDIQSPTGTVIQKVDPAPKR
jgi:penicillin-binding protein 2